MCAPKPFEDPLQQHAFHSNCDCKISWAVATQMSAEFPRLPLIYAPIKEQHLSKLKLLNSVIFPINYQVGALYCVVRCNMLSNGC